MGIHETACHAGQIAGFESSGWCPVDELRHALNESISLIIGKEENLILNDRTAKRSTELVLVIRRSLALIEEVRGVKIGVPQELENISVVQVRTGLGNHVNLTAAVVAI